MRRERGTARRRAWSVGAGGLMALVGGANALLGAWGLLASESGIAPGIAGGLLLAGVATAAVSVLVWRGQRLATVIALTFFGLLLIVQAADGAARTGDPLHLARLAVLALVVAALAGAALLTPGDTDRSP